MTFTKANGKRRVVVTGAGMVTELGRTWEEAYDKLKNGKSCVRHWEVLDRYNSLKTKLGCPYTGELPSFPRKKVRGMGRVALLSLTATNDALKMAGLLNETGDNVIDELHNGRTGIAYGCCMGSIDAVADLAALYKNDDNSALTSQTYIKLMPQTCAANLSVFYQLKGRCLVTDVACASGSQSIGYAYEAIEDGRQDIMIAGGADELNAGDIAIFDTLAAASVKNDDPTHVPAPFDKSRDGLVLGEGAGTLILEDLEHAVKRGAKIYAELVGFSTNMDGDHITSPNPVTQAEALRLSIKDAGIDPSEIAYVNTHGTATHHGDICETSSVYEVFKRPVPVSSTKSYVGHTLGACGAVEAWITINMMNEGWFHPTLNLNEVDEECAPLNYIKGEGLKADAKYVMSNNFAFGGVNTSLIFKKWEE